MESFLIEVSHPGTKLGCLKAIKVFLESGSHFLANAEWGCEDGEHKAWMIVNTDNKSQALQIVPPFYRKDAKVTKLIRFSNNENRDKIQRMEESLKLHQE